MGFPVNPYDPCIANKFVNGSQMTLRWHVDGLMISHKNMVDITVFIWELKRIYGDNLAESTEKKHNYLRMIFNFLSQDKVKINMTQYVSRIIKEFPEEILWKQATLQVIISSKWEKMEESSMRNKRTRSIIPCTNYYLLWTKHAGISKWLYRSSPLEWRTQMKTTEKNWNKSSGP